MPRRSPAKVDGTTSTPVILLGTTVTVLGALRLFAHRRIPAFVLSRDPDIEASSRWYRPLPLPPGEDADPARLESLLEHLPFEAAVLMPCTDSWARAVAGLRSSLAERFPASQADAAAIATLSDKGRFAGLADGLGIPHPRTLVLRDVEEFDSLPDERFLGSFLKPRNSEAFYRRYRRKATSFKTRAEARALFIEFSEAGLDCVLQEYVPGPATSHYFVDGFVDRSGRVLARFVRRRLRQWPADFGNNAYNMSVPLRDVQEAVTMVDRLIAGLRYRGIFSAEFKVDERTGEFKIIEVNCRAYWFVGFAASCGVDVCDLAYRDALRLPTEHVDRYDEGKRCHFLTMDWPACRALHRSGHLTAGSWARSWMTGTDLTFARDDPVPGLRTFVNLALETARHPTAGTVVP